MQLSHFGIPGGSLKTLIVLGAGASRGASFVTDATIPQPPLDLDFFQQLARMPVTTESSRLVGFIRDEYQLEVALSMEQFFSEADYTDRFHHELKLDRGPHVRRFEHALDDFFSVLPRMLETTTASDCEYHKQLATLLHTQDCVLSFNYDCIMDRALRDCANRRWDPDTGGYGFQPAANAPNWRKHSGRGRPGSRSIRLLKLHGSLNWNRRTRTSMSLVRDTAAVSSLREVIIPPTWFKNLTEFPFEDIWKGARQEIRASRIMVVVGYSVPQTDLFSRSLFKVEAGSKQRREKLNLLVLVNPDPHARRQFLDLIRGGVERATKILEYDTLAELASVFKRHAP